MNENNNGVAKTVINWVIRIWVKPLLNIYKIMIIANKDYYIDLLFYHLELRAYIVVELKTSEFNPE